MEKTGFIVLLGLLIGSVMLSGCLEEPEPDPKNGEKIVTELSFEDGLERISAIFEGEGLSLPDYSENVYSEDTGLDGLESLLPGNATKENLGSVKAGLEGFKRGLREKAQTEDITALEEYSDLLIETLKTGEAVIEAEETGVFEAFNEAMASVEEAVEGMGECPGEDFEVTGFEEISGLVDKIGALGEKAGAFAGNYPVKAEKAGVSGEFAVGVRGIIAFRDIMGEMIPLMGELCEISAGFEQVMAAFFEPCEDKEEKEAQILSAIDTVEDMRVLMEKIVEIVGDYPDAHNGIFDPKAMREGVQEFQEIRLDLEQRLEQLDILCE